jgi:hypothetical protein
VTLLLGDMSKWGPRGAGYDWFCDASRRDIDRQCVMKDDIHLYGGRYLPESCLLTMTFSLQKNTLVLRVSLGLSVQIRINL